MKSWQKARRAASRDLLVGGGEVAVGDVLADRAGEEVRGLEDDAQLGLEPVEAAAAIVDAVQEDLAASRLVEAAEEADEGGLAAAGGADQGDRLAGPDGEVETGRGPAGPCL